MRAVAAAIVLTLVAACGKKGPPLPPLVRLPAAPADLTAGRRGASVDIQLVVPSANTDGSRPADIRRVEVYAFSAPAPVGADVLLTEGTRVASVDVKAPRDPNRAVGPDAPASDLEPLQGSGADQGAPIHVFEELTPEAGLAAPAGAGDSAAAAPAPPPAVAVRTYVAVGVSSRGRRGPASRPGVVPLTPAPAAPGAPSVSYDEASVTLEWKPAPGPPANAEGPPPIDAIPPASGYHVYEVRADQEETRLTKAPVTEARFTDARIEWGAERCYTVRAVHTAEALSLEGDASVPGCATFADTFPPPAPQGLIAVASEGAINLIWDPSPASDLEGYLVLRGRGSEPLAPVTPKPIRETTFRDIVGAGVRYEYAVQAVDRAGNLSEPSARVDEAAR